MAGFNLLGWKELKFMYNFRFFEVGLKFSTSRVFILINFRGFSLKIKKKRRRNFQT